MSESKREKERGREIEKRIRRERKKDYLPLATKTHTQISAGHQNCVLWEINLKASMAWQKMVERTPSITQNKFFPVRSTKKPMTGEAAAEMIYTNPFTALAEPE